MADERLSGNIFPVDNTIIAKVERVATYFENLPGDFNLDEYGDFKTTLNTVEGVRKAAAQEQTLRLPKDIAVPVRQGLGVNLNFYPFAHWSTDVQPQFDDEGRIYRYREGRPSFRREPDDVKDAPDSDWPVLTQSRRRRNRLAILEFTQGRMGCRTGLLHGMDEIEQLVKKHMGAGRYRRLDIEGAPHVASSGVNPVEFLSQFTGLKTLQVVLDGLNQTP